MAIGRNYELKAVFAAEVDGSVDRAFGSMHRRLNTLQKKIEKVDKESATVEFDDRGLNELEARIKKLEESIDDVDKKKATPSVGIKKGDEAKFDKTMRDIESRLDRFAKRPYEAELKGDSTDVRNKIRVVREELTRLSGRAYKAKIEAEAVGLTETAAGFEALEHKINDLNREKIRIRTDLDTGGVNAFGLALGSLITKFTSVEHAMSNFSRRAYFLQQAAQVAVVALIGLGAAASGPLLSGLTILGTTVASVATGFGLIALAAAPIIHAFAQQKTNATQLQSAQDSLASSTESLRTAQNGLKDAIDGVAEARRAGQETIRSAVQAENDAAQAVNEANRSYEQAHRESADAAEELDDATTALNYALQTEQMRLRSMRYDVEGMKLSQKELALEIRSTEHELEKGDLGRQERAEAELRLQQLELQRKQGLVDIKTAQKELTRAEKNGTSELQSAIEARDSAKKSVDDAKQAEKDAARAVKSAVHDQIQALRDRVRARDEAARMEQDAMDAVAQAEQDVAAAAKQVKADQKEVNSVLARTPQYMRPIMNQVEHFKNDYKDAFKAANVQTSNFGAELIHVSRKLLPMLGQASFRTVRSVQRAFSQIGRESIKFGALESFQRILRSVPGITAQWTKAFGRFGAGFTNIMAQSMPYVRQFSRWVAQIALKFLKWTDSRKGRQQIHKFFESAAPIAQDLWKWITRIAGAILRWSINHPKELAAVLDMIGTILFAIVRIAIRVMNILFRIAESQHRWRNLALAIVGLRLAMFAVGAAMTGLRMLIIANLGRIASGFVRLAQWILRPMVNAVRGIVQAWKFLPRSWAAVQTILRWHTVRTVGLILRTFGRLTLVGLTFEFLVGVAGSAYREVTNNTASTVVGLIQMWRSGQINVGQLFLNIWRMTIAGSQRIILGGVKHVVDTVQRIFAGLFNWLGSKFGKNDLGTMMFGDFRKDGPVTKLLKNFSNWVEGDTNKMARDMVKNSKDGTLGTIKNMYNMSDKSGKATQRFSGNTKQDMIDAKLSMVNNTEEGKNKAGNNINAFKVEGLNDFKDFKVGGTNNMKDLWKVSGNNLENLKLDSNKYMKDMSGTGIGHFKDFNTGGKNEAEDLKVQSGLKMAKMQMLVNQSTHTTMEKGVDDLVNMQVRGTAAMADAQENWVDHAWDTAWQTQQSFNAILEGLSRFIDKADVDLKKPEQFSPVYRKGDEVNGGPRQVTSGRASAGYYRGGIERFASGGSHGPVGGVAEGTTRVYGEVPGTTEFYITDNPRYLDRNMEILASANQHMMEKMARGGSFPPKAPSFRNTGRDGVVDYRAIGRARSAAAGGARMWHGLVRGGGGDATVTRSRSKLGGGRGAYATTGGKIVLGPGADRFHAGHEFGHVLGLGHGGNGIMGGRGRDIGGPSKGDFAAIKAYYGAVSRGGRGGSGSGGTGSGSSGGGGKDAGREQSKAEERRDQREDRRAESRENRKARRNARRFRARFNRNRDNFGPLGEPPDYSRNALWMAPGGVHAIDNFENSGRRVRRGLWAGDREARMASGGRWYPKTNAVRLDVMRKFHPRGSSTYPGHGADGDPKNSVDFPVTAWGTDAQGPAQEKGNAITNYLLNNEGKFTDYIIWDRNIYDSGGKSKYKGGGGYPAPRGASGFHLDHVHWESLENNPGPHVAGGTGASGGGISEEDARKQFDKYVPKPEISGFGLVGRAGTLAGNTVREALFNKAFSNMSSGGSGTTGKSPKGLTADEVVTQGGWPDAQHKTAVGVMWEESSFIANNGNGTYEGLFAMGRPAMQEVGMSFNRVHEPLYNSTAAAKLYKKMGWQPWEAYPPSHSAMQRGNQKITGYSHGGLVTRPHIGMIGDRGPEVNMPLDDPRAMGMIRRAFDMSERVQPGSLRKATLRAIARGRGKGRFDEPGDGRVINGMRNANNIDDRVERAVDQMRERLEDKFEKLMDKNSSLSAEQAKQMVQWGMEMMHDMMANPRIGGDINEKHMAERIGFWTELTKK